MWDYVTFALDAAIQFLKHDGSPIAFLMAIAALLRIRKVQEELEKHLPRRFRRHDRLAIVEAKIDAIYKHLGVPPCDLPQPISNRVKGRELKRRYLYLRKVIRLANQLRRVKKMRNYLRKLGSRKFQAFLGTTALNLATLYLMWSGEVEVDQKVAEWGPLINLGVQVITTAIYVLVEGKVDKAHAANKEAANAQSEVDFDDAV